MFEESKWVQVWKDILVAIFYKVTGVITFSLIFRKKEKMENFGFYIEVMQCYKTKNMSNGQVVGSIYE